MLYTVDVCSLVVGVDRKLPDRMGLVVDTRNFWGDKSEDIKADETKTRTQGGKEVGAKNMSPGISCPPD